MSWIIIFIWFEVLINVITSLIMIQETNTSDTKKKLLFSMKNKKYLFIYLKIS